MLAHHSLKTQEPGELICRCFNFRVFMDQRRSLRFFSDYPVPKEAIEQIIMTASTAPSGAHQQPWTFCAVSNPEIKKKIREAAEEEEHRNYHGRMSEAWLRDLEPFGTDWRKPFLETAPWLIIVFRQIYGLGENGEKQTHYYVNERWVSPAAFCSQRSTKRAWWRSRTPPARWIFLPNCWNAPPTKSPFCSSPSATQHQMLRFLI